MAYANTFREGGGIAPSNTSQGVYPGTGLARGGQQGRMGSLHNGVGGAMGGGFARAGASPRARVTTPARATAAAAPARAPGGYLRVHVPNGTGGYKLGRMHRSQMTPSQLATAMRSKLNMQSQSHADPRRQPPAPGVPPPTPPPAPGLTPLEFRNSNYWLEYDRAQRGYRQEVDPMNAEVAALSDRVKYGGKTLYDVMYEDAEGQWNQGFRAERDRQAKANLFRSGAGRESLLGLDRQLRNTQQDISGQYGAGRLTQLQTQIANAKAGMYDPSTGSLSLIARAAQQDAIEREMASIKAMYGQTIDPSLFQFTADPGSTGGG